MANINFTVGAKLDRTEINKILSDLNRFKKEAEKQLRLDGESFIDVGDTIKEVDKLTKAIEKSFNSSMNRLDTKKLTSELSKVGLSIDNIAENMEHTFNIPGINGVDSLRKLGKSVDDVNFKFQKTESVISRAFSTLTKTAQWSMANQFVQQLENSISNSIKYTLDLNESLNNIRVVTGRSAESMVKFSEEANKVARGLGRTTKEYTDASLLYLQQGKTMQEAAKLTEATLVGANITGQSTAETSELLTAALNGYNLEAKEAMYITDVFANVGAKSGADFKELAVGFSKVASMAKTTGVSVEQLTSQLATISTVTREAPESIGTSLKTIYGRMTELRAGKEADDGWNMGKVQATFQAAGLSMINDEGGLKDVGEAMEEVGEKWGTFNKETQLALTQAMAGARQQNRLIALFNNWDMYQDQLENGLNAQGAAMEQNEIRMDSLEYKSKQLKAAFEAMWAKIVNDEMIGKSLTAVTSLVDGISRIIDSLGGIEGILKTVAPLAAGFLATGFFGSGTGKKAIGEIDEIAKSLGNLKGAFESIESKEIKGIKGIFQELKPQKKTEEQKAERAISKVLTPEEAEAYEKKKSFLATFNKDRLDDTKKTLNEIKSLETKVAKEIEDLSKNKTFEKKTSVRAEVFKLKENRAQIEKGPKKGKSKKLASIDKEIAKNETELKKLEKAYADAESQIKSYKENIDILSDSIDKATEESHEYTVKQVEKTKAEIASIENTAKWSNRLQVAGQVAAGAGVAITGVVTAVNTYNDNALDFNAQTDAMVAGITSLGSGLMMLPGPWSKVAGAVVMAGAAVAKFIRENTGIGKVIKTNESAIESFSKMSNGLKNDIKDLNSAQGKLTEMQAIADSGIDNTNRERYVELQNEIADLTPELVSHYDSEGNAVIKLTENIEALVDAKKKQLQVANQLMVNNQASFGLEYGMILSQGEDIVGSIQSQMSRLQEKGMQGTLSETETKRLAELQERYQDTVDKISNASENIRQYVVQPFLDSDEVISKLNPKLQGMAASLYDVDTVSREMKLGYEMYKITGSTDSLNRGLEAAKKPAQNLGLALKTIETASRDGDVEAKKTLETLENMNDAAKELAKNLTLKFNLDARSAHETLNLIAKELDPKTGIIDIKKFNTSFKTGFNEVVDEQLKRNRELQKELSNQPTEATSLEEVKKRVMQEATAEIQTQIDKIQELGDKGASMTALIESGFENISTSGAIDTLNKRLEDTKKEIQSISDTSQFGSSLGKVTNPITGEMDEIYSEQLGTKYGNKFANVQADMDLEKRKKDLEEINRLKDEETSLTRDIAEFEREMDAALTDYLFNLADTPEGFNALREQYETLYNAQAEFFELLDSADEDDFFINFSTELDSLVEKFAKTTEEVNNFKDALAEGGLNEAISTLGEEAGEQAETFKNEFIGAFENMSPTVKAEYNTILEDSKTNVDALVEMAKQGNTDALDQLSSAVSKKNEEIGRLYAAMNKDNVKYFAQFKKANKDQLKEVKRSTGIMAKDYDTLAEYRVALDKWQVDNAEVLANKEVSDKMIAANQIISDKYEADLQRAELEKDYTKVAGIEGQAQAEIATVAHYSQVIAKGEAEKKTLEIVQNSIIEQMDAWKTSGDANNIAMNAASTVATEELGKVKIKIIAIDGVIKDAKAKIAELAGEAPNVEGYDSIKVPNTVGGGGNKKKPIDYGVGATPPVKPTSPGGGGGGPDVGGGGDKGGGGSGKEQEPETVEDIEDKVDVYRDVETALKEIGRLTSEQVDKEKDMYGETKLSSMQKRLDLIKQEVEWEKKRREIAKGELGRISKEIQTNNSGVEFDKDTGLIKNYNQILQSQIDKINAIADTEADAKKEAIERYEALKALMEEYESHLEVLRSSQEAEREKIREMSKLELEKLDYKVQVELDITALERQTEEFLMKLNDGIGSAMDKFIGTADRVNSTIGLLNGSISDIASMEQHIKDIQNSTLLTPEDKLAELKKSKDEMIKLYETAMKYRKELEKLQIDAYKNAGSLLQDHLKQFDGINKQLKSMMDILKLTGQLHNKELVGSIMDTQAKTLDSQLRAAIASRDALFSRMGNLKEGSEQWRIMRDEVKKLDEQILKITNDSLKLYQEQLKYTVDGVMKELEKALTNNNTFKEVDEALKKQNAEKKEYLSTTEKILSISKLQQQVQKEMEKTTDPAVKAKLQKFLEEEVNLLKEKDKLTHYDMERAEKMLGITMKQIALDNARNNKTLMRLVRTSTGNWAYQYVADAEKVEKAQSDLSNALNDLLQFDQKRQEEVQKNMLDAKKDFYKKLEEIMKAALNGEYKTQDEFNKAIEDAEKEFNQKMEDLNVSLNTANKNLSESTLAAILDAYKNNHDTIGILTAEQEEFFKKLAETTKGEWSEIRDFLNEINEGNADSFKDKYADIVSGDAEELFNSLQNTFGDITSEWDNSVSDMITSNGSLKEDTSTAVGAMKDAWGDYLSKVEDVTAKAGLDIDGMKDRVENLGNQQEILDEQTDQLIGKIMDEIDSLQDLQGAIDDVIGRYDDLMDKVRDYMRLLDELIEEQKKAMDPEGNTPTGGGDSGKPSGGSTGGGKPDTPKPQPPKPSGSQGNGKIEVGDKVTLKSGRTWYHTSYGDKPTGPTTPYVNKATYVGQYYPGRSKPIDIRVGSKTGTPVGWLTENDITGFDTGGYTGEWGKDGKMAMLHEKEIVLNKSDTKNILDIVKIARQMISSIGGLNLGNMVDKAASNIQQHVTIQAEFPNVNTASEIEKAFANMGNQASQYALQKGRTR